jgi:hypothetical protein
LSLPSAAALPAPALRPAVLPLAEAPGERAGEPAAAPVDAGATARRADRTEPALPAGGPAGRVADAAPPKGTADTAVAAPIPLLPSAGAPEIEKAAIPVRPGPGSGGLY